MFDEKQYRKEYYLKNKTKILVKQKSRYKDKKQEIQEYQQQYYTSKDGKITRFLFSAKKRAKAKNLEFDIDLDFLRKTAPNTCPVFGFELDWNSWGASNGKAQDNSPSIDRIDSSKGYVKDNVIWLSWKANRLKNNATHAELFTIANWLKTITEDK